MASMKRERVLALNLIFGLMLLGWPFLAVFSLDLFSGASAPRHPILTLMLLFSWAYPLTYIGALAWSHEALDNGRSRRHAVRIALLPALNLVLVLGLTLGVWARCGHDFGC
ncbi:hypothetical protein OPU71_08725 [Niveibacterium sp. 24ML]|uniref:hypothetical protein n=1 Tax=Niveibacterium sp. 24ML TaxID=2985512 RepID=UPI0022718306|nr:hypothetical protein [Niveibacterium sp. 24ML]MCX9156203.1 hypothetical protein [Niveibacterium sp. 24ML]